MEQLIGEDFLAARVCIYMGDTLIFSKTKTEHLASSQKDFKRLEVVGLRIRWRSVDFFRR
jgi:hypothetical protein